MVYKKNLRKKKHKISHYRKSNGENMEFKHELGQEPKHSIK
jgi:hypothetical protein